LVLERLAFQAHASQDLKNAQETADISSKDLTHELYCAARADGKDVKIGQLYEYLRDRVGINVIKLRAKPLIYFALL
jgi:protein tyrosine/serine phosphatase